MRPPPRRRGAESASEVEPPLLRVRRPARRRDRELVEAAVVERAREGPARDRDLSDHGGERIADVERDQLVGPHEVDRFEPEEHCADRRLDDGERRRTPDLGRELKEVGRGIVEDVPEERPERRVLEDEKGRVGRLRRDGHRSAGERRHAVAVLTPDVQGGVQREEGLHVEDRLLRAREDDRRGIDAARIRGRPSGGQVT